MDNSTAVRFFAFFGVLSILAAAGTAAAQSRGPNDGALAVKNAEGKVVINGRGAVIGRFDRGSVTIKDPNPNDGTGPIVTGADAVTPVGEKTTKYSGTNIRFRIIGGAFTVTVVASDIDLSAIGKGMVVLNGTVGPTRATPDNSDATYAVNGGTAQPFPSFVLTFQLAAPQPGSGG